MTTATISSPAEKYLQAVQNGLADLPAEDVDEVLQDLAAHIAELGDVDPAAALGSPETFVAEFRASAGLAKEGNAPGRIRRSIRRRLDALSRIATRMAAALEPITTPITRRREELRIVWIWSRGPLGLAAYSWITAGGLLGVQRFFGTGGVVATASAYLAVVVASVGLAGEDGKWWRRVDSTANLAVAGLLLAALATPRYVPEPQIYYPEFEATSPVLLIGPNGPIQNLYAYDTSGNPVQVLLYDEYGNPILTLPDYAYEEAGRMADTGEPFIWEGYELRFATDAYGRPVGNLYPLDRYEWTETGARSAPQPPPVVGIPGMPEPAVGAVTESGEAPRTTTAQTTTTESASVSVTTTTSPASDPTQD
jgi:hypothetical protein